MQTPRIQYVNFYSHFCGYVLTNTLTTHIHYLYRVLPIIWWSWIFWFQTFPIVQKWQRNWPKLRRLAVFLLVFCLRESIQVKNNPNLQKMLEEDILYVARQCRTLVLLLSKLNGKEFSQRSVVSTMYFKRCSNIHRQ